jgi:hypothetical protein
MVKGKTPPMRKVAGRTVTQAATNWQIWMASTLAVLDDSSQAKKKGSSSVTT